MLMYFKVYLLRFLKYIISGLFFYQTQKMDRSIFWTLVNLIYSKNCRTPYKISLPSHPAGRMTESFTWVKKSILGFQSIPKLASNRNCFVSNPVPLVQYHRGILCSSVVQVIVQLFQLCKLQDNRSNFPYSNFQFITLDCILTID